MASVPSIYRRHGWPVHTKSTMNVRTSVAIRTDRKTVFDFQPCMAMIDGECYRCALLVGVAVEKLSDLWIGRHSFVHKSDKHPQMIGPPAEWVLF